MGSKRVQIEIIARGALVHNGRILLCRGGPRDAGAQYWYLPGGHVEFGEPAAAALAREFEEECGLRVRVGECLLVGENLFTSGPRTHHEVSLLFHVEHTGDPELLARVESREESIAFDWADLAAVIDMDVRPPSVRAWLAAGGPEAPARRPTAEWVSEVPGAGDSRG